jgi:Fe-S-cluster containining protein
MVPIAATEASMIRELVEEMPDDRRRAVRKRFADAVARLDSAGLLDRLKSEPQPTGPEYRELGLEYFHLGIPCPFLENESCSIHPDRPLVCREYLVVSPPENCQRTNGQQIEVVRMPLEASKALADLGHAWTPLTMVLDQPEIETRPVPGTKIATQFFTNLTHTNLGKG